MINDNNNNNLANQRNRRGTGFTNIGKIISANRQNRLGSALQSGVQSKAEDVKTGLEQTSSGFQQQAQSGRLGTQSDIQRREDVLSRFQPTQSGNQNTGFQDVGEEEIKDFERFRSGEYKGPQALDQSKTQQLRGKAQQAESLGEMTKSTAGRQELLKRFAGGEDYTRGQQRLDTLLLGQTGANQLKQARRGTVGLLGDVSEAEQAATEQAKQFQQEAQTFGQQTTGRLADMFSERDKSLEQTAQERLQQAEQFQQNILDKLSREEALTDDEIAQLGLTPDQAAQLKALQDISGAEYISGVDIEGMQLGAVGKMGSSTYRNQDRTHLYFREHADAANRYYQQKAQKQQELQDAYSQLGEEEFIRSMVGDPNDDKFKYGIMGNPIQPGEFGSYESTLQLEKDLLARQGLDAYIAAKATPRTGFNSYTVYDNDYGLMGRPDFMLRKVTGSLSGPEIFNTFRDAQVGQTLDPRIAQQLGLYDQGGKIIGIDKALRDDFEFERYLQKFDPSSVTKETVASADQLAALNALQRLSGQQAGFDVSKAGTAQTDVRLREDMYSDAINKLFGEGQLTINEQGQWVPQTNEAAALLNHIDNIMDNPLVALGTGGASYGVGTAAELAGKLGSEIGLDQMYNDFSSIGGDLNPLSLTQDAWKLGDKAIGSFTKSVGENLSKAVGTVICTELHRQGIMPDDIYEKDVEFGKKLKQENPEVFEGYFIWARHIAKLMSKSKLVTKIMTPFALAWANQMAGNENKLGKFILKVGVPVCGMIGKIRRLM